jgi:hypothetical protein
MTKNLWGGLTWNQLTHKWFGGQASEIERKIGASTMAEIISIIERRRGDFIYRASDVPMVKPQPPIPPLEVNPKAHHYVEDV